MFKQKEQLMMSCPRHSCKQCRIRVDPRIHTTATSSACYRLLRRVSIVLSSTSMGTYRRDRGRRENSVDIGHSIHRKFRGSGAIEVGWRLWIPTQFMTVWQPRHLTQIALQLPATDAHTSTMGAANVDLVIMTVVVDHQHTCRNTGVLGETTDI